jgi:hypothetical protein
MLDTVEQKITNEHLSNVSLELRDVLTQTTELAESSMEYVLLFNILLHDSPIDFLTESYRILKPKGKVGILY